MAKVLHLTLKKKWFDMIASGEKKEEYREIKPYWISRLTYNYDGLKLYENYEYIIFRNGYSEKAPSIIVKCLGISKGQAKPEWSDNWQGEVFIIKLGDIIK
jgi:hypothetical protein